MANGRDAEHEQLAVDRADADREPSRCAVEIHRSGGALAVSVQAADDAVFTAVGRNAAPGGPAREVDEGRWNVRRSEELGALRFGESVFGADRSGRRARMGARGERRNAMAMTARTCLRRSASQTFGSRTGAQTS